MNDPLVRFAGDRPYADSLEYVEELSVFVDLRISEKLQERADSTDAGAESREKHAIGYLQNRLREKGLLDGQTAERWAQQIVSRRDVSEAAGRSQALDTVIANLGLPEWMTEVLIYFYNAFLDREYTHEIGAESLYEVLCLLFENENVSSASIGTMLRNASSVIGYVFPECDGAEDILHVFPQMDIRLYELIIGGADAQVLGAASGFGPLRQRVAYSAAKEYKTLPYGIRELEEVSVQAAMLEDSEKLRYRFREFSSGAVILWGPAGVGKHTLASCVFEKIGRQALEYDAGECVGEVAAGGGISSLMDHTLYAIRECMATDHALVVSKIEKYAPEHQKLFMNWIMGKSRQNLGAICILIETEIAPDYLEGAYLFGVKTPDAITRAKIWKHYLDTGLQHFREEQNRNRIANGDIFFTDGAEYDSAWESCKLPDEKIQQLANSFTLTPGQIKRAVEQAFILEDPITSEAPVPATDTKSSEEHYIPSQRNLYKCCYAVMGHPLKDHTQKVESPFKWDDIKMDPKDKALLRDVCDTVRNRHIVMQEWDFESKIPYGAGVTVLFAGPPGTGKTMAAQVIANELGMELYKIDLSQLIDKYVGETEKNIRRVFDQAKKSNSVLFFDEADAIFNKRMDAKDANERFANIESSLLLQCVEEFDGISILATNNMAAIDNAFLRRFRYYLLFKEPDENIRYEIWKSVFPKQAPIADEVDYHELAKIFKFTGAIIKNVALTSAYLAAAQGTSIGLMEIMVAIKRELEKNHRLLTKEEMGSLGYLFARVSER